MARPTKGNELPRIDVLGLGLEEAVLVLNGCSETGCADCLTCGRPIEECYAEHPRLHKAGARYHERRRHG